MKHWNIFRIRIILEAKSVALVSGTWHDEVETFKEYSQTAMSNTASLSTLAKNGWLQRKKKHSSTIITLKVCWHWNVKVCSLTTFFHFSLSKKTTFCNTVFIVTKTPSSDLLWFETRLLPHKKAGKFKWKFPNCLMSWFCCLIIISTIVKYFFHYIVVT